MSAPAQRCQVMGIVNVTDDSFSDGGKFNTVDTALAHAHTLIDQGADIIDIGGESTRPGATRVSESQELARVVPVVRELAAAGILVSVDTMRASVAAAALEAGAGLINDVSGGQANQRCCGCALPQECRCVSCTGIRSGLGSPPGAPRFPPRASAPPSANASKSLSTRPWLLESPRTTSSSTPVWDSQKALMTTGRCSMGCRSSLPGISGY